MNQYIIIHSQSQLKTYHCIDIIDNEQIDRIKNKFYSHIILCFCLMHIMIFITQIKKNTLPIHWYICVPCCIVVYSFKHFCDDISHCYHYLRNKLKLLFFA